jgi:tetratricopeptide (TPR) repeat protein
LREGKLQKGKRLLKRALDENPKNYRAMVELAIVNIKLGNYSEGIKLAKKLSEVSKDMLAEASYIMALLYRYMGEYRRAHEWFQSSIILFPEDRFALCEYYRNIFSMGKKPGFVMKFSGEFYCPFMVGTIFNDVIGVGDGKIPERLYGIDNYKQALLPLKLLLITKYGGSGKGIFDELVTRYGEVNFANLACGIYIHSRDKKLGDRLIKKAFHPSYYLNDPYLYLKILKSFRKVVGGKIIDKIEMEIGKIEKNSNPHFGPSYLFSK